MEKENEVKKSELIVPLLENFKKINEANINLLKQYGDKNFIDLEEAEIVKNNVLAMCEITNTLNNVFGTY